MLELHHVTAGYGTHTVLREVSACFAVARLTIVIGTNGCGKSTLLKAIQGILPLTQGSVTLDGTPLSSMKRVEIARRIAYLAQSKNTPDMTVRQLVLHGRFPHLHYPRRYTRHDREVADAALERMGLSAYAEQSLHTLSGGMRQTAYIAMALAQDTDYILLDEPTTYLDISHRIALMQLLRQLARSGKGIVAVTHDLPTAFDVADEIALMDGGQLLLRQPPAQLSISPELQRVFGVSLRRSDKDGPYFCDYPRGS